MSTSKHDIHNEIITLYQLLSMEERTEILTKLLDEPVLPSNHNTPPKSLSENGNWIVLLVLTKVEAVKYNLFFLTNCVA
jgi:hypothetical protein